MKYAGPSQAGGLGELQPFLAKQLTLSQPVGQIMPTTVLRAPPDFQTLRRHLHITWPEIPACTKYYQDDFNLSKYGNLEH